MQNDLERPLRASLSELAIHSSDPKALSQFYERALGYSFVEDDEGLLGVALDRRLRINPGASKSLRYAAFAVADVADLDQLRGRLTAARVAFDDGPWPGFSGAVRFADPDGNNFLFGIARPATLQKFQATASRPARLQHIVFASTNPARLIDFYIDVVGFTLSDRVLDDEGGLRTAFVRCGHEHHNLAVFLAPENRIDHHCLEAGDWDLIRDWSDHFADERIPLRWGPGRHGPGNNLFVFVHDLDGNWVEISAELEQVTPDRPVGNWPHEERTLNSWGIGLLRS